MKRKFFGEVTTTTQVEIEIDDAEFTPEFMEQFKRSYYSFTMLWEHINHIAKVAVRDGDSFIEGYGNIKRNGSYAPRVTDDSITMDINIKVYDSDTEADMEEVTPRKATQ